MEYRRFVYGRSESESAGGGSLDKRLAHSDNGLIKSVQVHPRLASGKFKVTAALRKHVFAVQIRHAADIEQPVFILGGIQMDGCIAVRMQRRIYGSLQMNFAFLKNIVIV